MNGKLIVVDGYVATAKDKTNLRKDALSLALDQRAFGPRRLLVAFANARGRFLSLAHTPQITPIEAGLGPCIKHLGQGAAAAVAYSDEPVKEGPPPPDLARRFAMARSIAATHGIHLVDWFICAIRCPQHPLRVESRRRMVGRALRSRHRVRGSITSQNPIIYDRILTSNAGRAPRD